MKQRQFQPQTPDQSKRRGVSTLEYVLILGVLFPLVLVVSPLVKRIIQLVYEMTCTWVGSPFL